METPEIFSPTIQIIFVVILSACLALQLARFVLGPTVLDRLVAMESLTLGLLCFVAIWGLVLRTEWFMDFTLVLSLVGFLSTVAVARYIDRGRISDD